MECREAFLVAFEGGIVHTLIEEGTVAVDNRTEIVENELASEMEMEIVPLED